METEINGKEVTIPFHHHYDKALEDQKELMLSKFDAIREAIIKSDKYAEYRDNKQNEFRGALDDMSQRLADQARLFATTTDLENLNKQFEIWMSGMKQLQEANFNVAMDKAGDVKADIEKLKNLKQGSNIVWPWVITIVMSLAAIISFVINILRV